MEIKFADIVQIIVALIAFAGVVYSTRYSRKEKKPVGPSQLRNRHVPQRATVLLLAGVILLMANLGVWGWRIWGNSTEVKITEPLAGASVGMLEMVKGTSRNIPSGQTIWVVIYSQDVGRYYPQNEPADIRANGGWDSRCSFGVEQDSGKKFDIIAVLTNKEAQDTFNSYLTQAREQKSWPGLERLPDSAVRYDRITVIRK